MLRLLRCNVIVSQAQVNDVADSPAIVDNSEDVDDDVTVVNDQNDVECDNVDNDCDDVTDGGSVPTSDCSLSSSSEVAEEQRDDPSLAGCWKLADKGRVGFVAKDNLLYHRTNILGQDVYQLVVPESRRAHVLKMGHDSFGGHMGFKRTKVRISYTFYWPGLHEDCLQCVKTCETCQLKARVTYRDRLGAAGPRRCFHSNNLRNVCDCHNFRKFHVRVESVAYDSLCFVNTCAVVYENGEIDVIPLSTEVSSPVSPSEMTDRNSGEWLKAPCLANHE